MLATASTLFAPPTAGGPSATPLSGPARPCVYTSLLPSGRPLMADMPVIVRHQDRGALRLDHRHDQALCRRQGPVQRARLGVSPWPSS